MFSLLYNCEGQQTSAFPHWPPAGGTILLVLCLPFVNTLGADKVTLGATWHSRTFSWQHQTNWTLHHALLLLLISQFLLQILDSFSELSCFFL